MAKFLLEDGSTATTDSILEDYHRNDDYLKVWSKIITTDQFNPDGTPNFDKISDGYHTFGELYEDRAVLFATLCTLQPTTSWYSDDIMNDNMFIAGIDTDEGTIVYHINNKFKSLFKKVKFLEKTPEYNEVTYKQRLDIIKNNFL